MENQQVIVTSKTHKNPFRNLQNQIFICNTFLLPVRYLHGKKSVVDMCSIRLFYLNLQKTELLMQDYQLDFITYCVGNLADRLKMSASTVYKMLRSTGILDGYIVPCYDVLHTFSKDYIMDDLIGMLKKKGALS